MAMNVGSYYSMSGAGPVFPSDRLYGSSGVHDIDNSTIKFDTNSCVTTGYPAAHGFDAALHGYQGQLQQQSAGLGYGPFDGQPTGGKTPADVASYPAFDYAPCRQPSTYPAPPSLGGTTSRYLHDTNKFDAIAASGNDVISQYGGRHFGTAAMMAAAAVATAGGQHHAVGPAGCPALLPIYPWMRSMGAGMNLMIIIIYTSVMPLVRDEQIIGSIGLVLIAAKTTMSDKLLISCF